MKYISIEKIKKIVFFNLHGKGDIHVSRSYIIYFIKKFSNIEFEYTHRHGNLILKDIPEITYVNLNKYMFLKNSTVRLINKDVLFLSTWYASSPDFNGYCNLNTLHRLFDEHLKFLNFHKLL